MLYSLLIDSLAQSGFTVVCTPYAVSFKHLDCAAAVRQDFMDSLEVGLSAVGICLGHLSFVIISTWMCSEFHNPWNVQCISA